MRNAHCLLAITLVLTALQPAAARPGSWGGAGTMRGWGESAFPAERSALDRTRDSREGRIDADSFIAENAAAILGHGEIVVTTQSDSVADARDSADYEAAMVDQLVKAGYDTSAPAPDRGQIAEIRISRAVLVPEEPKRKPVSGEMSAGVSNHGTMMGMAIFVDLSKPRKALQSTRLEATIRDRASGKALWEGHAEIATREGDARWTNQAIAARLAGALFKDFPAPTR
jgi:hypothetical protein